MTKEVEEWLRSKCPTLVCVACGQKRFSIEKMLAQTVSSDKATGRFNYMSGYPLVLVLCQNCGQALFFSSKVIGVK